MKLNNTCVKYPPINKVSDNIKGSQDQTETEWLKSWITSSVLAQTP